MAKTVKFNMRFGDSIIRTVEDLQENFAMEDVLEHFENGLLKKFLERRGYTEYVEKIEELSKKDLPVDLLSRELVSVFIIEDDESTVNEYVEILRIRCENQKKYEKYAQGRIKEQLVIGKYFKSYNEIVESLIKNKDELSKIKAGAQELLDTYEHILEKDWRALLFNLINSGALYPVCHMLTKEYFRNLWLIKDSNSTEFDDTKYVNSQLVKAVNNEISNVSDNHPWVMRSNKIKPDGRWEEIEYAGKTYMILDLPSFADVRPYRDKDNEMNATSINEKFIVLNGIEYRHNKDDEYMLYAEV